MITLVNLTLKSHGKSSLFSVTLGVVYCSGLLHLSTHILFSPHWCVCICAHAILYHSIFYNSIFEWLAGWEGRHRTVTQIREVIRL